MPPARTSRPLTGSRRGGAGRRGGSISITSARRGLTEDLDGRVRRYLVSMGVRTACFVVAVLTTGPVRWTALVGAVLLPYIAVVVANAGRENGRQDPSALFQHTRVELPSASSARVLRVEDDAVRADRSDWSDRATRGTQGAA